MSAPRAARARELVRAGYRRLRGGELTPGRAAASVALGLAIGVTPLFGVHLALVLALCVPLRLDAAVAYLAANVSLPFIAPALALVEIEIGARLLDGRPLSLDPATLSSHGPGTFARELCVGTLVLAPAMAAVGGALTYLVMRLRARG